MQHIQESIREAYRVSEFDELISSCRSHSDRVAAFYSVSSYGVSSVKQLNQTALRGWQLL